MARLGIDFGTSTTVAVVALPGQRPRPLLFDGSPLLPSAVCVGPTGLILVGRDALHTAMARPAAFEPHPKQRVDDGTVLLGGTEVGVQKLFGAVLDRVLLEAANVVGDTGEQRVEIVVTCPVAWGSARRATLLAAAPPGTRLVEEPVAAAHRFVDVAGNHLPEDGTAVVYDFGAGTFDAAVVRRTGDGFVVVASRGLPDCGGLDLDAAIVAHLAAAVPDTALWRRLDEPATATDRRARQQVWANVRTAKEMLSRATSTQVYLPLFDTDLPLGREELDQLAAPILDRTVATVREVLDLAGVDAATLAAIFLCGGSSRMPAVVTHLHRAFGFAPVTVDQPETAVAEGCLGPAIAPPAATVPAITLATATTSAATATTSAATATTSAVVTTAVPGGSPAAGAGVDPATGGADPATAGTAVDDAGATTVVGTAAGDGPPPVRPAWLAGYPRRRGGRVGLAAGAGLGVLALIATALSVIPGGDDEPRAAGTSPSASPSPSPSPSPSYPPGIDPCVLGTWRMTMNRVEGQIDNDHVQYAGGAGVVTTYKADGTFVTDYSKMQQRVTTHEGVTWTDVTRGTTSGRYSAETGKLTETVTRSDAVGTLRRNGKFNAKAPTTYFLEPATYRCSGSSLTLISDQGNYSEESVRVVPPSPPAPSKSG